LLHSLYQCLLYFAPKINKCSSRSRFFNKKWAIVCALRLSVVCPHEKTHLGFSDRTGGCLWLLKPLPLFLELPAAILD